MNGFLDRHAVFISRILLDTSCYSTFLPPNLVAHETHQISMFNCLNCNISDVFPYSSCPRCGGPNGGVGSQTLLPSGTGAANSVYARIQNAMQWWLDGVQPAHSIFVDRGGTDPWQLLRRQPRFVGHGRFNIRNWAWS